MWYTTRRSINNGRTTEMEYADKFFVDQVEALGAEVLFDGGKLTVVFPATMERRNLIEAAMWIQYIGPNGLAGDPVILEVDGSVVVTAYLD
jgi:hypothetical protein